MSAECKAATLISQIETETELNAGISVNKWIGKLVEKHRKHTGDEDQDHIKIIHFKWYSIHHFWSLYWLGNLESNVRNGQ